MAQGYYKYMLKYLPIGIVVVLMVFTLLYLRFFRFSQNNIIPGVLTPQSSDNSSLELRVKSLEDAVVTLAKQISKNNSSSDLDTRVKVLEDRISSLQQQPNGQVITNTSPILIPTSTPTVKRAPVYIPLGSGGTSAALDWTTIDTYQVILDPNDYPGYSSAQLELSLRVYQGNGKAFARLYNSDDGLAILLSEVASITGDYTWVVSSPFNFSSAKKSYKLQLKTLTGYEAGIQNARLKINFY